MEKAVLADVVAILIPVAVVLAEFPLAAAGHAVVAVGVIPAGGNTMGEHASGEGAAGFNAEVVTPSAAALADVVAGVRAIFSPSRS
jgi:hypothetical protein